MSNRENDGSEQPPAHEEVGYGKPPTRRRFKKSGNLKGRPKGSRNRKTIVKAVANEMHTVLENGKRRRRSTLDLVLLRLRNMALKEGNDRAFEEFHRLIKAYQPWRPSWLSRRPRRNDAGRMGRGADGTQQAPEAAARIRPATVAG